ncbi:ketosteroid isomerase-like protein [Nocardioides marinisabuli]|uniref:Ketosteroid isomerase-like protein n=1 Tax=Nocardioides marinisabuli TaxID=419476 RepID=A0A7Y9EZI6_9ACTN|nr:nuclear transport factor 2 family protein [Nocardioides marinisabuli]NYD56763.1 ketosteroid isomerase-like protein [Nocardioides marinisabuli]
MTTSLPSAISSPAVEWHASLEEHPARLASMRSYSAVAKGDLEEWLGVYAEDAVLEDPVGPSMFDPEGRGHHGHEGIAAFWRLAIEPIATFRFVIRDSFANGSTCANVGTIHTAFADGGATHTDLVMVYTVGDDGRVRSMRAFWEPERTMATYQAPAG